jgi:hypothetical protein
MATRSLGAGIDDAMMGRKRSRKSSSGTKNPNIFDDFTPAGGKQAQGAAPSKSQTMASQISQNYQPQGGGGAADMAQMAAMASGNPYAMGASLGLEVLQGAQKKQRQYEENLYRSELQKLQRQQAATRDLVDLARGLKL